MSRGALATVLVLAVAVGVVFLAVAIRAGGWYLQRALMAAVGAAWLLGSAVPPAQVVHQGLLAAALVAFPSGRVRGAGRWALVALAVPVGLGVAPQGAASALFALVAAVAVSRRRADPAKALYPALAAAGIAAVLGASALAAALWPQRHDPVVALVAYQVVLLGVAAAFAPAASAVLAARARLAEGVLDDETPAGVEGLSAVLAAALRDPSVAVHRWPPSADLQGMRTLAVHDGSRPLAVVAHRSPALEDRPTADAVTAAIRLAVTNLELQERLQAQLGDLEAARARVVAAVDDQRAAAARQLDDEVVRPLRAATLQLAAASAALPAGEAADALDLVMQELSAATEELAALVAGAPPARLGDGRLHAALGTLARRCPVPVAVTVADEAVADAEAETALFYVCSEALANAVKHADATHIAVTLESNARGLTLAVSDDGRGGAATSGSGLLGLADRVAAARGRLRVESPPGAGTSVVATLPR